MTQYMIRKKPKYVTHEEVLGSFSRLSYGRGHREDEDSADEE